MPQPCKIREFALYCDEFWVILPSVSPCQLKASTVMNNSQISLILLGLLMLPAPVPPALASEGSSPDAAALRLRGEALAQPGTQDGMEKAMVLLADALGQAREEATRQLLNEALEDTASRYDAWVREHVALFLDVPRHDEVSRRFYTLRAACRNARGLRQYGEFLLEEGDKAGWQRIEEAASLHEPRALFLLAERYEAGKDGLAPDAARAYGLLQRSAGQGYAPACEMLAQAHWDGSWGCQRDQKAAMDYLRKAIGLYNRPLRHGQAGENANLQQFLGHLNCVLLRMGNVQAGDIRPLPNFYPSYNALMMSSFNEDSDYHLQARLFYLIREMERNTPTIDTGHLAPCRGDYVPVSVADNEGANWAGLCSARYHSGNRYSFNIKVDPRVYKPAPLLSEPLGEWFRKKFMREIQVSGILAHEMGHGYMFSRYFQTDHLQESDRKALVEGFAANTAYDTVVSLYFSGNRDNLPLETYESHFCASDFRPACEAFRRLYMADGKRVDWGKVDEQHKGQFTIYGNKLHKLAPDPSREPAAKPRYFGRAFYGLM